MKYNNVVIESFAYNDPEFFISSEDLEKRLSPVYSRLNLPHGRLELQTSIKSRGFWNVGTKPSTIASDAAEKALVKSKFCAKDIDLLIYSGVCRDHLEPSTASSVHFNLKLKAECMSFDLSNACLGFANSMSVASEMIERGTIKNALIVTGENSGPLIEETVKKLNRDDLLTRKSIKKYIANLTIGSAGVAFILSDKGLSPKSPKLLGGYSLTDSSAASLCKGSGNADSLMMETESEELLHRGIALAEENWIKMKEELSFKNTDFQHIVCHQVGIAHRNLMYERLDLDLECDHMTFDKYGNTGSAALPLTFIKAVESGRVKAGDKVALLGIGSGLHSIMLGVEI